MTERELRAPAPAVVVITTVRDGAATLERTLASVRRQTYRPVEHIVVDGGSTDGTLALLERHAGRVRWVSGPDRGPYDAMNKGLGMVRAPEDYVVFLGADDEMAGDDALERLLRQSGGEDVIYGMIERLDERTGDRDVFGRELSPRDVLLGRAYAHQAMLCRRRVFDRVGGFDLGYRVAADYEWLVRAFRREEITRRFVPAVVSVMRRGGMSERRYLTVAAERWRAVRRHYPLPTVALYSLYTLLADYLKYAVLRLLRALGLLAGARRMKARLSGRAAG